MGGLTHIEADEENPLGITPSGECLIPAPKLAHLLHYLDSNRITGRSAKSGLAKLFDCAIKGVDDSVEMILDNGELWFSPLPKEEYEAIARRVLDVNEKVVEEILAGKEGKINFLLGQMIRLQGDGRLEAQEATAVLKRMIERK
jgi:aspartyl-tRNA(Asn)/glutamyl-tRNA(Gln) amidotransferase subunit B